MDQSTFIFAVADAPRGGGAGGPGGAGGFPNPFAGPGLMAKLRADPRTKDFADQPDFQNIIRQLQANPSSLMLVSCSREALIILYRSLLGFPFCVLLESIWLNSILKLDLQIKSTNRIIG